MFAKSARFLNWSMQTNSIPVAGSQGKLLKGHYQVIVFQAEHHNGRNGMEISRLAVFASRKRLP